MCNALGKAPDAYAKTLDTLNGRVMMTARAGLEHPQTIRPHSALNSKGKVKHRMTQPGDFDFSGFEKFEGIGAKRKDAAVSIQSRGSISLNAEAFKKMGTPDFVELFYNTERAQIMLKAADKGQSGAARMRSNGNQGGGALVATKAFFDAYEVAYAETRPVKIVLLDNGVLIVEVPGGNGEQQ